MPGRYTVEVTTADAVGEWRVRVTGGPPPPRPPVAPAAASAGGMLLVAAASVWLWRHCSGAAWQWFGVGALVWAGAVAVKFAIAAPLNGPLLTTLNAGLPRWAYLTAGAIYGGALTGLTEVLFTYLAALIWRRLAADAPRGIAIGAGAGAFEAALLALGLLIATVVGIPGSSGSSWAQVTVPVVERTIAIPCHVAARALALLAVAKKRSSLFWGGFLLLSGIDAVAMLLHLTGQVSFASPWMIQALIAPFGMISVPITIWCVGRWPVSPAAAPAVVGART
jgi:hypothetical protein